MVTRFNFTKTALTNLTPPEEGRTTVYDVSVPKLALRATAAGTKTFYVIKRLGQKMEWVKLGVFPDMTVEMARNEAQAKLGMFAGGDNPAQVRRKLKAEPTLDEFFEEYGERHGRKKATWRDDQQRFRDYLAAPLGKTKLSEVTRESVGRILSKMDRAGKAGATVNQVRALISGMFNKAIEWSYVAHNPVQGIKLRPTVKRDRFLQTNELPRFLNALLAEGNHIIRDYLLLSLLTGARRENVLSMRWDQVDLDGAIWYIPKTKNHLPQHVPLSQDAIAVLQARKEGATSPFVFPGTGKTGHLVEPKKGWQRVFDRDESLQLIERIRAARGCFDLSEGEDCATVVEQARQKAAAMKLDVDGARLPHAVIHDLRRTLGSWQAKTGASLLVIGKSLNHKSQQATLIYARLDLDPVRESVKAATDAMLAAAGVKPTPLTND